MPMLETTAGRLSWFDNGCVEGDAPRLMLLHSGAASHRQWRPLIAALGRGWHIVAPDLVGHGETPMPDHGRPTLEDEVALLAALLERMDGPVHLIGHSYGGAMALELARRQPQRIASLAMYEPVAFGLLRDSSQRDAWREIALVAQRHIDLVENGDARAAAIAFLDYWVGPGALLAMPEPMQAYVTGCMRPVASEFRELLQAGGTAADDLKSLTMPVLLLCGSETTLAVRGVIAELRRLLPAPRHIDLAGATHMAPLLRPDLVNPLFTDFLNIAAQLAGRGLQRAG
ncbi:MAG: alpha/beta fold hydrolase [Ferrovibrio sp.]|uniref:alpha/beta fold hydrolase n=1 Tax=Ferrovibrio sp. TaxID=1917215 RepID=UPI00261C1690|nr:alpha/beta hydrolase [Ferrovibrio sp.]MCW0235465.1 alpha/beta fold hydrolase [Ferrovibrio sp.]